jgi:hypothetical protein
MPTLRRFCILANVSFVGMRVKGFRKARCFRSLRQRLGVQLRDTFFYSASDRARVYVRDSSVDWALDWAVALLDRKQLRVSFMALMSWVA